MANTVRLHKSPLHTLIAFGAALLFAAGPAAALWAEDGSGSGMYIFADHPQEGDDVSDPLNYTLEALDAECAPVGRAVRNVGNLTEYSEDESACIQSFVDRMGENGHTVFQVDGVLYTVGFAMTMTGLPEGGASGDADDADDAEPDETASEDDKTRAAEAPGLVGGVLFGLAMLAMVAVRKL